MTLTRQPEAELVLVASERQAEDAAARGARVITLQELASSVLASAAPEQREATRETTRLLTLRTLDGKSPALGLAVDAALGQLRRAGTKPADVKRAGGSRAALLAAALERSGARLQELGLRDDRENASLAARALPNTSIRELQGVRTARVRGVSSWGER